MVNLHGPSSHRKAVHVSVRNSNLAHRQRPAMAAPCPLLGDGITDDTLLNIARFIPTARDLLNLCLACPRFAANVIAAPRIGAGGRGEQRQRRRCCRSRRRRRGSGWLRYRLGAASRSVAGCLGLITRAGWV